ncbi:MAG: hypothetical protein IPG99_06150 [Ignavibacteria bacterium]|nr:hypothetical protein [Ignavibacteria bacterium]
MVRKNNRLRKRISAEETKEKIREMLLVHLNTGSVSVPLKALQNSRVTDEVTISNLNTIKRDGNK